jgi:hypothetical protein
MQVLSTLNMVDVDIQNLFDKTVQEKVALSKELERFTDTDQKLTSLQKSYDQVVHDRERLIRERGLLSEKKGELETRLSALQRELNSLNEQKSQKDNLQKSLEEEVARLKKEKEELAQESGLLGAKMASLNEEIASLKSFKNRFQKQDDLSKALERENAELKEGKARLAQDKARIEARLSALQKEMDALKEFRERVKEKGDVVKALEAEKKKLEKSLDMANQKLAALKTLPLKIKTRSLPTTLTGEKVHLTIAAEGGSPPYTWTLNGSLPKGLSFNRVNGTISGIVGGAGNFNLKLKVVDARAMSFTTKSTIPWKVVERPGEKKKKVSPWFMVMTILSSLLLIYIMWGKYKARKVYKKMIASGYVPRWIKEG